MKLPSEIIAIIFAISLSSLQAASGKYSPQLALIAARCFATNTKGRVGITRESLLKEVADSRELIDKIDAGLEILSLPSHIIAQDIETLAHTFRNLENIVQTRRAGITDCKIYTDILVGHPWTGLDRIQHESLIRERLCPLVNLKIYLDKAFFKNKTKLFLNHTELTFEAVIPTAKQILASCKAEELQVMKHTEKLLAALNYQEPKPNRII